MAQEFDPAIQPQGDSSKRNTALILMIVAVILICCCCVSCAALYYGIEPVMQALGIPIPWY
jgi:hypothetical protein